MNTYKNIPRVKNIQDGRGRVKGWLRPRGPIISLASGHRKVLIWTWRYMSADLAPILCLEFFLIYRDFKTGGIVDDSLYWESLTPPRFETILVIQDENKPYYIMNI